MASQEQYNKCIQVIIALGGELVRVGWTKKVVFFDAQCGIDPSL